MKHTMRTPCKHCPFRSNIKGYLRKDRVVEIAQSVIAGQFFPCHKTTEEFEDEDGESDLQATENSAQCAGAEIFAAHHGASSQMSRIAERLGMKVAKLDMRAKVCKSLSEMVVVHCGKEEGETCEIVGDDCIAPAGYSCGSGAIEGVEYVTTTCSACGRYVCDGCSKVVKRKRVCEECQEDEAAELSKKELRA